MALTDELSSNAFLWTLDELIDLLLGVFMDWRGLKICITKSLSYKMLCTIVKPCC